MQLRNALLALLLPVLVSIAMVGRANAQCNDCWLEARGTEIVNATTGQPVILRAVGLGNWLLQEGYMLHPQGCDGCPGTQWQMKQRYLDEGAHPALVEAFYQAWRDSFITEDDIAYIASLGFNSVRLPMHYELFLTDEQRRVRTAVGSDLGAGHDAYKASLRTWLDRAELFASDDLEGFRVIDRLIEWCEAHGMYVILDMHAAPGSQGSDRNISDGFYDNNLWLFPVFQDTLDRLWKAISDRYKDEPRIAMYEFINEPNNVPGGGQAIHALTQRLITTVRDNGDNHLLGIHGDFWTNYYGNLEPFRFWPNWGLVYNAHRYWIPPEDDGVPSGDPNAISRIVDLTAFRDRHRVPVWVGETGENSSDWLRQNIDKLEDAGVGWCHWTYKRHDVGENAALARIGGSYPTDGVGVMGTVLESIRFENIIPNPGTLATVTARLPEPGATGCGGDAPGACAPVGRTVWIRGSHGGYMTSNAGLEPVSCDRVAPGRTESFTVFDVGGGKVALRASNGRYLSSENSQNPMTADKGVVGAWERFEWLDLGNGSFALRGNNGLHVSSENGEGPMWCDRERIGSWESFRFGVVQTGANLRKRHRALGELGGSPGG